MYRNLLFFVAFATSSAGCAVYQLGSDQDKIRSTLLDLYTNQIIDNLIRAHNKLPIIQMDYSNATATVTMKESSGVNDGLATTAANVFTAAAASMLVVTKTTLNTVTGLGSLDHTNQISVVGTPVTTTDSVYDAYEKFLSDGGLNVTCDPPPQDAAHVCKRCGNLYYWVPVEYQKEFLRLSLATTSQRAQPVAAADAFYSVNFLQLLKSELVPQVPQQASQGDEAPADSLTPPIDTMGAIRPQGNQAPADPPTPPPAVTQKPKYWLTIKIDKKIPIDEGYADVGSGGQSGSSAKTTNPGQPGTSGQASPSVSQDPKQTAAQTGTLYIFPLEGAQNGRSRTSDELRIFFDENNPPTSFKDLNGFRNSILNQPLAAKVYLRRHRPQTPPPGNANSRVEFFLQQIQQGQFRNNGGP